MCAFASRASEYTFPLTTSWDHRALPLWLKWARTCRACPKTVASRRHCVARGWVEPGQSPDQSHGSPTGIPLGDVSQSTHSCPSPTNTTACPSCVPILVSKAHSCEHHLGDSIPYTPIVLLCCASYLSTAALICATIALPSFHVSFLLYKEGQLLKVPIVQDFIFVCIHWGIRHWIRHKSFSRLSQVISRILQNTNDRHLYMGICKSRVSQPLYPTRPTAKQLWKWAVARIIWLLKLRRKWAHISKTILQHPSHQSLFDGLERRQGKLIRKKFYH